MHEYDKFLVAIKDACNTVSNKLIAEVICSNVHYFDFYQFN